MTAKIYFISGVCGVGKSAIIPYLKEILPHDKFDVRDFDERGVPDGADRTWRKSEIKNWLEIGTESAKRGITTLVCGFAKNTDLEGQIEEGMPGVEVILLHANPEIIRGRLVKRYSKDGVFDASQKVIGKPVTEFIESNVYYCNIMRKECDEAGCKIIDTSDLSPGQVAHKVGGLVTNQ